MAPSAGEVPATEGEAIVVNETVRSFAVPPPWAPRRPVPTVTVYVVFTPRRCVGLNESTVRVSFHESFPGGTLPDESRIAKPACADGSIGWLNATSTCWMLVVNLRMSSFGSGAVLYGTVKKKSFADVTGSSVLRSLTASGPGPFSP